MNTARLTTQPSNALESTALSMLAITQETGFPVHYQDDISFDLEGINKAKAGAEFIWVLRKHGTAFAPVREGINPSHIVFWLKDGNKAFLISDDGATIKPITYSKAIELMHKQPPIDSRNGLEAMIKSVNNLLQSKQWPMWEANPEIADNSSTAHWRDYLHMFRQHKNIVMTDYMERATKLKDSFIR